jgi:hypothetical protein
MSASRHKNRSAKAHFQQQEFEMNKLLAIASSLLLAFSALLALPTVAYAQGASPHVEQCRVYVDLGLSESIGECVRGNNIGPVELCQFLRDEGLFPYPFDDRDVVNLGDCVRWFKQAQQDQ